MSKFCRTSGLGRMPLGISSLILRVAPLAAGVSLGCTANATRPGGHSTPNSNAPADINSPGGPGASGGTGSIGTLETGGGTGTVAMGTGGGGSSAATCALGAALAPARVWLLSDEQVVKVVSDVLGATLSGADAQITTASGITGNYTNFSEAFQVDAPAAQGYQRAAIKVAQQLKPCGATVTATCVEQFVNDAIAKAWRRPLLASETAGLMKIYNDFAPIEGPDEALSMLIQAALQSGSFLYRTEIGTDASQATAPIALTSN